jgi:hypothetical protein
MQNNFRWIAFALPLAVALIGAATTAQAFTDSNAALKEAAAERQARVVIIGKATPPARSAWVPTSPKQLDGFRPVMPPEQQSAQSTTLARAEARAARR